MRIATLALTGALGLAAMTASAIAAPAVPHLKTQQEANIIHVWGGCGWGFRPTRWGGCVPARRAFFGPPWHRHAFVGPGWGPGWGWGPRWGSRPGWHGFYGGGPGWHARPWWGY